MCKYEKKVKLTNLWVVFTIDGVEVVKTLSRIKHNSEYVFMFLILRDEMHRRSEKVSQSANCYFKKQA